MANKEKSLDSGLVVVVFIITREGGIYRILQVNRGEGETSEENIYTAFMIISLVITVFSFLLFVDYEWCPVLFKNNTVRRT